MKKERYYSVICPLCKWKTVGNSKEKAVSDCKVHILFKHLPEPIVKTEKR